MKHLQKLPGSSQTPTPGQQKISSNQQKLIYLCQNRMMNPEVCFFAYCMCRNMMSTPPCCNRKQKIRVGEASALPENWSATVFVYVVLYKAEVTDTNNPFWQLQPYFCFPNSFRWLPVYLLFLNACLILRRMCVYKCCTICSLGCTATAWKFSTGWQRGMKKKMKSDVLVIIARHSKIYFWRNYLSWRFICRLYNCQMTMQILAVTWQQMTFPPHVWKWSEI